MLTADLNTTRRIGCEFEMALPETGVSSQEQVQETLARIFSANGLPSLARPYSHAPVPDGHDLCVEFDSSVRGESRFSGIVWHKLEVKTRILGGSTDFDRVVPRFCELARYLNARVTSSCGFHVHLDVSGDMAGNRRFIRSLLNLFWKFEPVIYGLVPRSRRSGGYAQPIPDRRDAWNRCRSVAACRRALSGWSRYIGLNTAHILSECPRIEARWHSGTLNAEKARRWVIFLNRMLDHAAMRAIQRPHNQVPNTRRGLERMLISCGFKANSGIYAKVDKEVRATGRYLLKRWKELNGDVALKAPNAAIEEGPF